MVKAKKICLAASAGGHLSQLLRVAGCTRGHEVFIVTTSEAVRDKLAFVYRIVDQAGNRARPPVRCPERWGIQTH